MKEFITIKKYHLKKEAKEILLYILAIIFIIILINSYIKISKDGYLRCVNNNGNNCEKLREI